MAWKRIDEKTRQEVRESYDNGVPKKKIGERFSISVTSVNRIISEKSPGASKKVGQQKARDAEIARKIAEIERRIAELEGRIHHMEAGKKKRRFWF